MATNQSLPSDHSQSTVELSPVTRERIKTINRSIESVKDDARRIAKVSRQELEEVADRYSRASSTFLAAIVGGTIGSAGGITLGTAGAGALIVTGPLGLALGAGLAVLAFRGRSYWRLEKATQKSRAAAEFIRGQIDSLPPDAPAKIRDGLYDKLGLILEEYARIAHGSLDG